MSFEKNHLLAVLVISLVIVSSGCVSNNGENGSFVSKIFNPIKKGFNSLFGSLGVSTSSFGLSGGVKVEITENGFDAPGGAPLEIKSGKTVTIENTGENIHNVRISQLGIDKNIGNGEIVKATFDDPGEYMIQDYLGKHSLQVVVG